MEASSLLAGMLSNKVMLSLLPNEYLIVPSKVKQRQGEELMALLLSSG